MQTLRQAALLVLFAGTLAGCGSRPALKDRGTGSPVAQRSVADRGADAGAKGEARGVQPATTQRPAPVNTAKGNLATGREPAVALDGDAGTAPVQPVTRPETKPESSPESRPQPNKSTPPAREPAVDLNDTAPGRQPSKPAQPAAPSAAAPSKPDEPPVVRTKAATLEELREVAIGVVLKAAASDDPTLRANAIEASGLAPRRLSQALHAGLADRNEAVQAVAAMTVGRYKLTDFVPKVRPLLESTSPYVSSAAVMALGKCDEKAGDERLSKLAEHLWTSTSPKLRSHVAYVVGELGNTSALPMLRQAASLKMPSATPIETGIMLLQFAEAMYKLGDAEQIDSVRAALYPAAPEDLEAAAVAAQILGELRDRKPLDQMVVLTTTRDSAGQLYPAEVRMAMAAALAKLGLDRGGFIADEFAGSPDILLRTQAAGVYGDTGRREHLAKLAVLIDDDDDMVRVSAAAAVLKIANRVESGK